MPIETDEEIDITITDKASTGDTLWAAAFMTALLFLIWELPPMSATFPIWILVAILACAIGGNLYKFHRGPRKHHLKVSKSGIYESRACSREIPWKDIEEVRTRASLDVRCRNHEKYAKESPLQKVKTKLKKMISSRWANLISINTIDYFGYGRNSLRLVRVIAKYYPPWQRWSVNPPPPGAP